MKRIIAAMVATGLLLAAACSEDAPTEDTADNTITIGDTIHVPADAPTIQAGIDLATTGKVVLVAAGTYSGPGNRDLDFKGKAITLQSVSGPDVTIINCRDTGSAVHQGFYFSSRETFESVVDGFSIINANASNGGGMGFRSCSPTIRNCVFSGNEAYDSGGAIRCKAASPTFVNCTFTGNSSPAGGGVFLIAGASPHFENCIISFSPDGGAVFCSYTGNEPTFVCCNIFGNEGGDWVDCIAAQADANGNMSADPLFCDRNARDFHLQAASPCAPANNSCASLIGALNGGCEP